jgi:hypothetical protein
MFKNKTGVQWERPLFVVSAGRSGSTYLTNVLNAHPDLALTHEARILQFYQLTHHMITVPDLVTQRYGPFELFGLIPEPYKETFASLYLEKAIETIQDFYKIEFSGKPFHRWGEKLQWVSVLPDVLRFFPDAQFIHIIRDGRDRLASTLDWYAKQKAARPDIQESSLEYFCEYWVRINHQTAEHLSTTKNKLEIRYEALIRDRDEQLKRLFRFLEIKRTASVDSYLEHQADAFREVYGSSKSALDSIGRWKTDLDDEQQAQAHALMGEALERWGYETDR